MSHQHEWIRSENPVYDVECADPNCSIVVVAFAEIEMVDPPEARP